MKNIISHKPMPAVLQKEKQNGGIGWDGSLIVLLKEKCFVPLHVVLKLTKTLRRVLAAHQLSDSPAGSSLHYKGKRLS